MKLSRQTDDAWQFSLPGLRARVGKLYRAFAAMLACLAAFFSTVAQANDGHAAQPEAVERFAALWEGFYSNERQVRREELASEPDYPEAVRLLRDMRVHRLDAPQIGEHVLFLEEIKSDDPDKAHRQRVMTLDWHADTSEIEVNQLFFAQGPSYDRSLLDPAVVAQMPREAFRLEAGCNLFFTWNAELERFEGGMRPRKCEYVHPESGLVYAEFDMVLDEDRLWYRDRSIIIETQAIRGEIEGFSWLRFDRLSDDPANGNGDRISKAELAKRLSYASDDGVWEGTFRRIDANGEVIEVRPSRIEYRFLEDGEPFDFAQVNILDPGQPTEERIESRGKWDVDRLRFSNQRLNGYAIELPTGTRDRHSVFMMEFTDGSGLTVSEIITVSPGDPDRRMRATQYIRNGEIIRRTLIEETFSPLEEAE